MPLTALPVLLALTVLCFGAGQVTGSSGGGSASSDERERDATTQPDSARWVRFDARVIVASRGFAEGLGLDPDPVEALMTSEATVASLGDLTGQVLIDAAGMDRQARLMAAAPLLAEEGKPVSALLTASPAYVAMPEPTTDDAPQLTCVLRAARITDADHAMHGGLRLQGMVLGGIDLAMPRPEQRDTAQALDVPSVRFAIDLPDGDHAFLALPFDLTDLYDGQAPDQPITLLLIRATGISDDLVDRSASRTTPAT